MIAKKCLVGGRVQGVFYRATAAHRARELGVTGHALNLPDGRGDEEVPIVHGHDEAAIALGRIERAHGNVRAQARCSVLHEVSRGLTAPARGEPDNGQ